MTYVHLRLQQSLMEPPKRYRERVTEEEIAKIERENKQWKKPYNVNTQQVKTDRVKVVN